MNKGQRKGLVKYPSPFLKTRKERMEEELAKNMTTTLEEEKTAIEAQFNETEQRRQNLTRALGEVQTQLVQLQGQHRLILRLIGRQNDKGAPPVPA